MSEVRIGAYVAALSARMWWRRTTGRIGRAGALALLIAAPASLLALYVWAWGEVSGLTGALTADPRIGPLALPSLMIGFVTVCVVLRAAMLAFDVVAPDLRIVLHTAPLTVLAKALIQVLPDFVLSTVLAVGIGSVGLTSYAYASGRISIGAVLCLAVAVVAIVGMLSAVMELMLLAATKDAVASRAGAAAGTLLLVCGLLLALTREVQVHGLDVPLLRQFGALLLAGDGPVIVVSILVTAASLLAWGWFSSRVAPELLRAQHRQPVLRVWRGSVVLASFVTFWRDPANRVGALGMLAIGLFGILLERVVGLPLALPLVAALVLCAVSAASLYAYGEFLAVRWRFLVAPSGLRRTLLAWCVGHLLAGAVLAVVIVLPAVGFLVEAFRWVDPDAVARFACALVGVLGLSLVAGRLLPFERDDVFALAASLTLAVALCAAAWLLLGGLPTGLLALAALSVLTVSLAAVVGGETRTIATR